jgi:hypothetical protein
MMTMKEALTTLKEKRKQGVSDDDIMDYFVYAFQDGKIDDIYFLQAIAWILGFNIKDDMMDLPLEEQRRIIDDREEEDKDPKK